jgi:O-antigen/teichoic acid export membrane protein
MSQKIKKYLNKTHRIVFGTDAGENMIQFTKNISMSFSGGLISFGVLFIANVIATRVLGPEEYGKYAIVFSIAQMLALFYVLELDVSALYFLADKKDEDKSLSSSINAMFLINIAVFTLLAISLYTFIVPTNISQFAFISALCMALSFAFKRMIDAYLRVNHQFKKQSIFKIAEAITVVSILIILFYAFSNKDYFSYVNAIILGGIVFVVLGGVVVRKKLILTKVNKDNINKIFEYNVFGLIGASVNGIIKNIDKLIVVAFLGITNGGIYAAYFTASVLIGARLTQLFVNVFFPTLRVQKNNKVKIFSKINKLFFKTFVPLVLIASVGVGGIIWFYGAQYPIVWYWILLGGLYIGVHFFASLYGWLLSSFSKQGYKKYNLSFLYSFFIYAIIIGMAIGLNYFNITILLSALIIYRMVSGLIVFNDIRQYLRR